MICRVGVLSHQVSDAEKGSCSPSYVESRVCEAVEECVAGVFRSFGEVSLKAQQDPRLSSRGAQPINCDGGFHG